MKLKFKTIRRTVDNKRFLFRLSLYFTWGSIKAHLIIRDDIDTPHTHPWNYKSLLIVPYKETTFTPLVSKSGQQGTLVMRYAYWPLKVIRRDCKTAHTTSLYRFFGIPIPALTIGFYSNKKQLCSFCQEAGYCKQSKQPLSNTIVQSSNIANDI